VDTVFYIKQGMHALQPKCVVASKHVCVPAPHRREIGRASNLTKALDYTRKYFKQAMTVKGTFEDFAEATALARPHPPRARQVVCDAALLSARSRSARC